MTEPGTPLVSILMPVHGGADAGAFSEAVESLLDQTRLPDEIVVVVDGPTSPAHLEVLRRAAARYPALRQIDLTSNVGSGRALSMGLEECRGTWVARADADDLNDPRRLETQLAAVTAGADVCGSAMTEVTGLGVLGIRSQPLHHAAIARRMKTANPVNHPTAFFRRQAALEAGGYQHLPFLEDYDLWARMLARGAQFVNLPDALVRFRADGMFDRRTGPDVRRAERELQRRLRRYGLVSAPRSWVNLLLRNLFRALPRPLMVRAYAILFRRGEITSASRGGS